MAVAAVGIHCATCQRQTLHVDSTRVNHVLHFLLGWITCAIWWAVWLLIVMGHEPKYACSQCGTLYVPPAPPTVPAPQLSAEERTTYQERAATTNRRTLWIVAAIGLLLLAATGAIDAFILLIKGRADGAVPVQIETARDKHRRLFVRTDGGDNGERGRVVRLDLKSNNMPCAGVELLRMDGPGTWSITCTDGPHYVIRVRDDGEVIQLVPAATPRPAPESRQRSVTTARTPRITPTPTPAPGEIPRTRALVTVPNGDRLYHTNLRCWLLMSRPANEIPRTEAESDGLSPHQCADEPPERKVE